MGRPQHTNKGSILHRLEGRQLSAVVFVRDYLQLQFDGPVLSIYVWPTIETRHGIIQRLMAGYRDVLCDCIGKGVESAIEVPGEKLELEFANATLLRISLRSDETDGAEVAMLQDDGGQAWNVW